MTEAAGNEAGNITVELELVAEVVSQQLESMLSVGNYDAVKLLLKPVQPVDIAEAIGNLPTNLQALAFRLLGKDEAISVYEYLDSATQQSLLRLLRSGEMREVVEQKLLISSKLPGSWAPKSLQGKPSTANPLSA